MKYNPKTLLLFRAVQTTFLMMVVGFFISCDHKPLTYSNLAALSVNFDWSKAPDAVTTGMTVLFFSNDNPSQEPIRYDFIGMNGGSVQLPYGHYQAITYNYDTESILYRGLWSLNALEAYTRESSLEEGTQMGHSRSQMPHAAAADDEPVILEPDPLWGAVSQNVTVDDDGQTVVMQPEQRVRNITITIHNVPNLQYTGQFGGALSGLSASVWMASGITSDECATQAFPVTVIDATTLQMQLRVFGHCPHRSDGIVNNHLLTIYAILADGSKWYYTQDITDQMHDAEASSSDDTHIYIELDELPLPKPIVNGSGFQPTMDGWQGIDIDVGM